MLAHARAGFEGGMGSSRTGWSPAATRATSSRLRTPHPPEITALLKMRAEHFHLPVLTVSEAVRAAAKGVARLAGRRSPARS